MKICQGFEKLSYCSKLITPVMGISWPCIFGKVCFDMLKSIGFGNLVRLFSSLRQSDRVYLSWFVWYSVRRLFKMQPLKRSVKTRYGFGLAALLALGSIQVYISNCWHPYVSPGWMIELVFFWGLSSLFHHVILVTISLTAEFQV